MQPEQFFKQQHMMSTQCLRDRDLALAHGFARVGLGINMATHGLTRLGEIPAFASERVLKMGNSC